MSTAISETIVQNVETTVTGVTVALGYDNTLTVERETDPFNRPRDRLAVVMQGDLQPSGPAPLGLDEYILPIGIVFYAIQAEATATAISAALNSIAADIRKALMVDVHRGSHAVNTEFEPDQFYTTTAPQSGRVTALIRFRTLRGNPYQR